MKKILAATAFVVACLSPLTTAKADNLSYSPFCTTGVTPAFCGSVVVTATPLGTGNGTQVTIDVLNQTNLGLNNPTSATPNLADPNVVFTSIGLENVGNLAGKLGTVCVTQAGSSTCSAGWTINANKNETGVLVDIDPNTTNGINYGIAADCSNTQTRIYSGGGGGCTPNTVRLSFLVNVDNFSVAGGNVYIKQQGGVSSDCVLGTGCSTTTTVPEPASIVLVGTGLMALGRRASNWRRRKQNV